MATSRYLSGGSSLSSASTLGYCLFFAPPATCRQDEHLPFDADIHGRVDQREEAVPGAHARKSGLFSVMYPSKKSSHGSVQAKVDFMEQLTIDLFQFRIMPFARLQRGFRNA